MNGAQLLNTLRTQLFVVHKRLSSEVDQFDLREMVPSSFVSGVTSDLVTRPKAVTIMTQHNKQTTRNRWTRFSALPDDHRL